MYTQLITLHYCFHDTQENDTVSGNLVMTTERVGILLGSTLDRNSNETVSISIVTENISKCIVTSFMCIQVNTNVFNKFQTTFRFGYSERTIIPNFYLPNL